MNAERQRRRHGNKTESAGKGNRVEHLTNKQFLNAVCCCLSRNVEPRSLMHLLILCVVYGTVKKSVGKSKGQVKEMVIAKIRG